MPDELISVEEHLQRVLDDLAPLTAAEVPLIDALGLSLADDVTSGLSLPRFDNSAMDGYAVRVGDLTSVPVTLPVAGAIGAGQAGVDVLEPGTVAKIMTGAPLPEGADAVVPYEWTDRGAEQVLIEQTPAVSQHVRYAGEDVREGDVVLGAGTVLEPRHLGLLASIGRPSVKCGRRPRVVVVSTGSELREPGAESAASSAPGSRSSDPVDTTTTRGRRPHFTDGRPIDASSPRCRGSSTVPARRTTSPSRMSSPAYLTCWATAGACSISTRSVPRSVHS